MLGLFNNNTCTDLSDRKIYLASPCIGAKVDLYINNAKLSKLTASIIIASCDAFVIFVFFIMSLTLRYADDETEKRILKTQVEAKSFAL